MAHWKLKIETQFADEIVSGMKNFEIRCESDKVFQKGDSVEFIVNPVDLRYPPKDDHPLTGRIYDITYVLHGWGLREDYCAFAIKERVIGITAELNEDLVIRPEGFEVKEFTDTLKRSVAKDIRKMCVEREGCVGCIFKDEDVHEDQCMLIGLPGDWKV